MAFQTKQGTFAKATGAAPVSQDITGLGFQPKVLILWCTKQTAEGFAAGMSFTIGFSDGTNEFSPSVAGDDNVDPSNTIRAFVTNKALYINNTSGSIDSTCDANLTVVTNGFRITWTTNSANAYIIHYLALGGTDLTNVKVNNDTMPAVVGNKSFTGVGFQGDCILLIGSLGTAVGNFGGAVMCLGSAVSSTSRWAVSINAKDNEIMAAQLDCKRHQRTDRCLLQLSTAGVLRAGADFVSWDSDGFTLNFIAAVAADIFGYLVLKGGQYAVGAFNKCTTLNCNNDVNVGFTPVGLTLESWGRAASTTISADGELSLGGSDGTNESTAWTEHLDGTLNTSADQSAVSTKVLRLANGPSTIKAECDADLTTVSNSFRTTWTTNDGGSEEICYAAFGSAAAAGRTTKNTDPFPLGINAGISHRISGPL